MRNIKIAFLALDSDIEKSSLRSISQHERNLYGALKKLSDTDLVIFKKIGFLGSALSFMLHGFFYDFSKYDIIYNPSGFPFLPLRKGHAKTFGVLHGLEFIKDKNTLRDLGGYKGSFRRFVLNPLAVFTLKQMDYVIAVSSIVKQDARSLGFGKDNMLVVNNGIDELFMKKKINRIKKGSFIVGYVGTLRSRKNVEFAIQAFDHIKDNKIKFEIWGWSAKMFEYERLVALAKHNKNIRFMGSVPKEEDLVSTYDKFDVFVFPSFYEGFGLPIIEAQARGLPVIIYKSGKISKEVRKYCFEAESPEHMAQIIQKLKASGYSERQRKNAMEYARSFTWEKAAKMLINIFNRVARN